MINTSRVEYRKGHITIGIRSIIQILLFMFLFNAIFIPVDTFQLKKIALIFLWFFSIGCILKISSKEVKLILGFGLILTTYTILLSMLLTGDILANIKAGYVGYILLLYPLLRKYNIDFESMLFQFLKLLAIFMVIMALLDLSGVVPMFSNPILMWLYNSTNAGIGKGAHLPIGYAIFMKASPMLLLYIPYCFDKKKYVSAFVGYLALITSGTRANIILGTFMIFFCIIYREKNWGKRAVLLLLSMALIIIALIESPIIPYFTDMFARKAVSDAVRTGTLASIVEGWKSNPFSFIIGSGYTSNFYNSGRDAWVTTSELSYWNLLRQVGIVPFGLTMIMYFYPAIKLLKIRRNLLITVGYLTYMTVAYTNPLLYSSTGLTTLLLMYYLCYREINLLRNQINIKCYGGVQNKGNHFSRRRRHPSVSVDDGNKQTVTASL